MPSKKITLLLIGLSALVICSAAVGAWALSGTGNGYSKAVSVPTGPIPTHTIATYPNETISWGAVSVGAGSPGYVIRRYAEAGALQSIGSACAGTVAALSCIESAVPAGRWQYTTQPVIGNNWVGAESTKSTVTEIAAPPTAVTCTTCTTFGATKYINSAGKASVTVTVSLAATSLATDTVHLTLTDGTTTITPATQAASAGAGTITFSGLNTTTLVDGNITATAWVTTNTAESSSNTTATLVRDTVAPSASDEVGTNGAGGIVGKLNIATSSDTLTYTFSEPMAPASILAAWNGSSTAVTTTFSNVVNNDGITTSANLGSIATNTNFTTGNITNTGTMVMSGSTVTITLAFGGWSATNKMAVSAASTWAWTPVATPTDQAGNPMTTTVRNQLGGPKTNF